MSDSQTHTRRLCALSFVPGFIYMYKFICLSCAWHCPDNDDDAPDAVVPEFVRIYVIRQNRKPGYWGDACFLEVDFSGRWALAVWCPAVLSETSTINLIANSCKPTSVAPSTLFWELLRQQHCSHSAGPAARCAMYLICTINIPEYQTLSNVKDAATWPHECKADLRDEFMTDIDGLVPDTPDTSKHATPLRQGIPTLSCAFFTPAPFRQSYFLLTLSLRLDLLLVVKGLRAWVVCLMLIKTLPSKMFLLLLPLFNLCKLLVIRCARMVSIHFKVGNGR